MPFVRKLVLAIALAPIVLACAEDKCGVAFHALSPDAVSPFGATYSNQTLGFSYPLPDGWYASPAVSGEAAGKEKRMADGSLLLLVADQPTTRPFTNRLLLIADDESKYKPALTAHDYVARVALETSKKGLKVVKDPYVVELAGKQFYRVDSEEDFKGTMIHKALAAIDSSGNLLIWVFVAGSPEELETAVNSLNKVSFGEATALANVSGTRANLTSVPAPVVTVSNSVMHSKLIKSVPPRYPEIARAARVQGAVVMCVLISAAGDVKDVRVVSGDPQLVDAAVDAVKQWKYGPFLLQGKAVEVEVQVTVNFTLGP